METTLGYDSGCSLLHSDSGVLVAVVVFPLYVSSKQKGTGEKSLRPWKRIWWRETIPAGVESCLV